MIDIDQKIERIDRVSEYFTAHRTACGLCPRRCGVDRDGGERGICGAGKDLRVYTAFLHQGEELPISGSQGSGTIFFSGCTLRCIFCQNYQFSLENRGMDITPAECARIMLNLAKKGAHNINLVTPTHFLPGILAALRLAYAGGLNLPVVYNCSGYEEVEVIDRLDGIVDIYLPDMKYVTGEAARAGSLTPQYPQYAKEVLKAMYRQKNTPVYGSEGDGVLWEGLIVRHLVLPGLGDDSQKVLDWIHRTLPQALVSVMFQYRPYFKAEESPQFNRSLTHAEYRRIVSFLERIEGGFNNGWVQEFNTLDGLAGTNFEATLEI